MDEKIVCYSTDHIEVLGLSVRVHNALRRAKYWDVGEVIVLDDDQLFAVRNLGEKGVAEIKERLGRIQLLDAKPVVHEIDSNDEISEHPQILLDLGPPTVTKHEVVEWQQMMVKRQIGARLLHPQIEIDGQKLSELVDSHFRSFGLYEQLVKILTAPITVSQELEELFKSVPPREIEILIRRYGFERQTLEEIGSYVEVTRERVRQLEKQAIGRVKSTASTLMLLRLRSAVAFADDPGLSFDDWSQTLLKTGLTGTWTQEKLAGLDPIEQMIVVCDLLKDTDEALDVPESLKHMIMLHDDGMSASPARMLALLGKFTRKMERLVKRHLRYSGAVSLEWLVSQDSIDTNKCELRQILESKSFAGIDENWFWSDEYMPGSLEKDSVLHRSLLKMFQFCGPLALHDVYFGIERTRSKTDFPIPPMDVLEQILEIYGYSNEDTLWFWPGDTYEDLNSGESAIWETIYNLGGVAHHSELMRSIVGSDLSGASLHGTLRRSPLFESIEKGLYRLRGSQSGSDAIARARSAAEKIPVQLTVNRDTFGNIIVEANLGILVIAYGTLLSDSLPNLSGNWSCSWGDGSLTDVRVTHNEIRGIGKVLKYLECEVGDRIALTFNVFDRTVAIRKTGD